MTRILELKWSVSRGRDTYGYNICSLYVDGRKVSSCNGGGYDMKGTALGNWVARAFADRLVALKPTDMPAQSHWQRAENPRRICRNTDCVVTQIQDNKAIEWTQELTCPKCGNPTEIDHNDGQTVDDGRYFYGLTYHDPNYDPSKAIIGQGCDDRTLGGKAAGKTVEQAEADGESLGLERYQAFYHASSKVPTERHTIPLIDGGCGFNEVEKILKAIGYELEYVPTRSRDNSIYKLVEKEASNDHGI
jgi:hypothetical protein